MSKIEPLVKIKLWIWSDPVEESTVSLFSDLFVLLPGAMSLKGWSYLGTML